MEYRSRQLLYPAVALGWLEGGQWCEWLGRQGQRERRQMLT